MKNGYRALIWEQGRTAGVICLMLGLLSGLLVLMVHVSFYLEQTNVKETQNVGAILFFFSLIGAGLIISRQDVHGHISWNFDPRWFRLPVSISSLFCIALGFRVLFLTLLIALQFILILTLPNAKPEEIVLFALFPLSLYVLLQALAWSWKRAPILFYGPPISILVIVLVLRFIGFSPEKIFLIANHTLRSPFLWLSVFPASILCMGYGVYLERFDRYIGSKHLLAYVQSTLQVFTPSAKTLKTSFHGQLWYETKRSSWVMPFFTLIFTTFLTLLALLISEHPFQSGLGQYLPSLSLIAAGILTGVKALFPRNGMQHLRPLKDCDIAAALMLAQLRGLLMAMLLAGLLALFLLLAGPMERSLLEQLRTDGFNPVFDVFIIVARPVVLAGMLSWLLIWIRTSPIILFIIFVVHFRSLGIFSSPFLNPYDSVFLFHVRTYLFLTLVFIFPTLQILYLRFKHIISTLHCMVTLLIFIVLSSFLWFGTRSLSGIQGLIEACALSMLLVAPIPSLTWFICAKRHDIGIRSYLI